MHAQGRSNFRRGVPAHLIHRSAVDRTFDLATITAACASTGQAAFQTIFVRRCGVDRAGFGGLMPHLSRRPREQRADQIPERRGIRAVHCERQPDPARGLPDPPDQGARIRRVFQAQRGWWRGDICAAVRKTSARRLESRVGAQGVEIIATRITITNGERPFTQNIDDGMAALGRVAASRKQRRQRSDQAGALVRADQKKHTATELIVPPSNAAVTFLWRKFGRENGSRVSSSAASMADSVRDWGVSIQSLNDSGWLSHARLRIPAMR